MGVGWGGGLFICSLYWNPHNRQVPHTSDRAAGDEAAFFKFDYTRYVAFSFIRRLFGCVIRE